jgi:hypothetical protein
MVVLLQYFKYRVRSKTTAGPASTGIRRAFNAFWMLLSMNMRRAGMPPLARTGLSGYFDREFDFTTGFGPPLIRTRQAAW